MRRTKRTAKKFGWSADTIKVWRHDRHGQRKPAAESHFGKHTPNNSAKTLHIRHTGVAAFLGLPFLPLAGDAMNCETCDDPCCPECDGEGTIDETFCDLYAAHMALRAVADRKTPLARDELGMLREINSVLGRIVP